MSDNIVVTQEENGRIATVKLSDKKTIVFRELGGRDTRVVQRMTGSDAHMITQNLALYALVSVNGEALAPVKNEMHFEIRADKFTMPEIFQLQSYYDEAFFPQVDRPNE